MDRSVLVRKSARIERCMERVAQEYVGHEAEFETDIGPRRTSSC